MIGKAWPLVTPPSREGRSGTVARRTEDRKREDEHDEQTPTIERGGDEIAVLLEDPRSIESKIPLHKNRHEKTGKHRARLRRDDGEISGEHQYERYVDLVQLERTDLGHELCNGCVENDDPNTKDESNGNNVIIAA